LRLVVNFPLLSGVPSLSLLLSNSREFRQIGGGCLVVIANEITAWLASAAFNLNHSDCEEGLFIYGMFCSHYSAHPCKAQMDIMLETFYIGQP